MLYIYKDYNTSLSICENIWFQRLMLCQCPYVLFPFRSSLMEEVLLVMVKKTMDYHVLLNLASTIIVSASLTYGCLMAMWILLFR